MRHALVLLVLSTSVASATPLAQKWRSAGCPDFGVVRTDKELAFADRKTKTIVRRDIATGKLLAPIKLATKRPNLMAWLGDTLVISEYASAVGVFSGIDAMGKSKWKNVKAHKALALEMDLATALSTKDKVTVQRIAGATGKATWTATVPGSGTLLSFEADPAHVVVGISDEKGKTFTVSVLDARTGTAAWTSKLPFKTYRGALLDSAAVIVDEPTQNTAATAFHILDRATGKLVGKVEYKNAFPALAGGGRLFIGANDLDKSTGAVIAVNTRTAKPEWTIKTPAMFEKFYGFGAGGLAANLGNDMLRILDMTNGKILTTYGLASAGEFSGLATGSPAITLCDDRDLVALDAGGTDESAKISGTIACKNCDARSFPVRIGDVTGKTDDKGRFTLTVVGAGRFAIRIPHEENGDRLGDPGKFVLLAGKGTYDVGTLKVEIEPLGD
ncbi:MAG: PQQ-binding-like beta-propeller repeat protein [Deltaproteobacteria bacterium]|nr:PQQ-binding-like beta-propeller repeat protein [Deltaproteobacteria bacterium]